MRVYSSQIKSLLSSSPPPKRQEPVSAAPPPKEETKAAPQCEATVAAAAQVSLRQSILALLRELAEPIETLCTLAKEEGDASPPDAQAAKEREEEARQILEQVAELQASLTDAFGEPEEPAPAEPEEPAAIPASTFASRSFRLAGPTQKLPVLEALEFLRATKKSGRLSLSFEDAEACLLIDAGEVVGAHFGDEMGFDALCSILHSADGYVQFTVGEVRPEERSLAGSTLKLVLSALQCLDERDLELRR